MGYSARGTDNDKECIQSRISEKYDQDPDAGTGQHLPASSHFLRRTPGDENKRAASRGYKRCGDVQCDRQHEIHRILSGFQKIAEARAMIMDCSGYCGFWYRLITVH